MIAQNQIHMVYDIFEKGLANKDFKEKILHVRSREELAAFSAEYGLEEFNKTLTSLDSEDHKKIFGRIASLPAKTPETR
jgi:hypothetical protein